MSKPQFRIADKIRQALDETGLPWEVEAGGRHTKVRMAGRFVLALPRTPGWEKTGYHLRNSIATIRRVAREIKDGLHK